MFGDSQYRVFLNNSTNNQRISPWHDIPLPSLTKRDQWFPFVCEIPKGRVEKMEVSLIEESNPIAQDVKDGKPRILPTKPLFNYGMLPRTFESPDKDCPVSGVPGDGDPLDIVDISDAGLVPGSVIPVKILGSFCYIDGGQADWKVIVSSRDTDELNKHVIGLMMGFFETYKGKDSGNYVHDNRRLFSADQTMKVVRLASRNYAEMLDAHRNPGSIHPKSAVGKHRCWVPSYVDSARKP